MVLQPDTPHVHLKVKHPTSYLETLVHLVKTCAGTGILALPNSFIKSGWLVGVIGTLATGFLCTYAIHLLVRSGEELWRRKRIESITYHTTWQGAIEEGPERLRWLAPYAPTMTRTFFFVGNMGVASISVLFISSNIKSIVDYYQDPLDQFHIRWYSLGLLVPLILINWVRNLKYLAPVSTFGTAAFSISIAIVFYYIFQDLPPLNTREPFGSWEGLPQFFTTAIYAVECIGMIMPLRKEMKHSEQFSSVFGVVNVGMVLYLIIFTSFGFFGYLKYGEKSAASVTINMPQGDILSQVSKLLMALSIVTTHALNIYIAFDIFWNDFIKPRLEKKILLVEYIFRTILVTVTVLVAMVVPYLDLAISLMGGLVLTS